MQSQSAIAPKIPELRGVLTPTPPKSATGLCHFPQGCVMYPIAESIIWNTCAARLSSIRCSKLNLLGLLRAARVSSIR